MLMETKKLRRKAAARQAKAQAQASASAGAPGDDYPRGSGERRPDQPVNWGANSSSPLLWREGGLTQPVGRWDWAEGLDDLQTNSIVQACLPPSRWLPLLPPPAAAATLAASADRPAASR